MQSTPRTALTSSSSKATPAFWAHRAPVNDGTASDINTSHKTQHMSGQPVPKYLLWTKRAKKEEKKREKKAGEYFKEIQERQWEIKATRDKRREQPSHAQFRKICFFYCWYLSSIVIKKCTSKVKNDSVIIYLLVKANLDQRGFLFVWFTSDNG